MAIQPLQSWKDALANLPKVADTSWAGNFANFYASQIIDITTDPSVFVPSGLVFTFAQAVFQSQLIVLTPVNNALAGIGGFAGAWEAALNASTIMVSSGSALVPPSPATMFSSVISAIIDPASIALGKAKIMELVSAPPVGNAQDSVFPEKFRDATLLLTITVMGLNSVPPPPGPQPLTASNVPLV